MFLKFSETFKGEQEGGQEPEVRGKLSVFKNAFENCVKYTITVI